MTTSLVYYIPEQWQRRFGFSLLSSVIHEKNCSQVMRQETCAVGTELADNTKTKIVRQTFKGSNLELWKNMEEEDLRRVRCYPYRRISETFQAGSHAEFFPTGNYETSSVATAT